jgi:DNA polymerase II small subunit
MPNKKYSDELEYFIRFQTNRFTNIKTLIETNFKLNKIDQIRGKEGTFYLFAKVSRVISNRKEKMIISVEGEGGQIELIFNKNDENDKIINESYYTFFIDCREGKNTILQKYPPGYSNLVKKSDREEEYGALISDVHVGSIYFMRNEFISFLKYVEDTPKVKYVFIAGDLVDGIGVYPEQEKNLYDKEVKEQYLEVSFLFNTYLKRKDITVYFSPGNHDFMSLFEPQIIPQETINLLPSSWNFIKNPELVEIHDKKILFYHGRSFDNLISLLTPQLGYEKLEEVYHYVFNQRNLSPTVKGSRIGLLEDPAIISVVPDYFLTGHTHGWCHKLSNGVLFCNSGCWQKETEFQKGLAIRAAKAKTQFINISNPKRNYWIDFCEQKVIERRIDPTMKYPLSMFY